MSKNSKIDLTTGTPWKKILAFIIPLFLGNLVQQFYNTVDAAVAGRFIGEYALAAVGANAPIMQIAIAFFFGISMGANVLVSQNYGARNYNELRSVIDSFMIFIYVASIFLTIVGLIFAENLYILINTPEEILPFASSYLRIILVGLIAQFGYNGVSAVLRGIGDTKTPLMFLVISSVLNIALDILFVTAFKLGVNGLALATIISQIVSFIFSIIYLNRRHPIIGIHFRNAQFQMNKVKDIARIGIPSGFQSMVFGLSMFAVQSLVNSFGVTVMAGYNAAMRIDNIALLPAQNFGMTMSPFIGQNIGANKWKRLEIGVFSALIMVSIVSVVISALLVIFSKYLFLLFTEDPNVIAVGREYIFTAAPFYIAAGYFFTLASGIRGSGATFTPMLISVAGQVFIRVPLAYLFVYIFKSPFGIWLAIPMSWVSGSILIRMYYKSGRWKKHVRV